MLGISRQLESKPERRRTPSKWLRPRFGRYLVALAHFRVKYPDLEVKENPFANLTEDDNIPMDEEVPFDDSIVPPAAAE
ncbi:hypothetical protein BHE74_00047990 [Ensete ventricosum]|nr:hypothetical protein BHE74_00047990 [Ensete ventricosum]